MILSVNMYGHIKIHIYTIIIVHLFIHFIDKTIAYHAHAIQPFTINTNKQASDSQEYLDVEKSNPVFQKAVFAIRNGLPTIIHNYTVTDAFASPYTPPSAYDTEFVTTQSHTMNTTATNDGELLFRDGTIDIADHSGNLQLTGGTTMTISGEVNTIRGSVLVIEDSLLRVTNPPKTVTSLNITEDLTVGNDTSQGSIDILSNLHVGNNLNIHNGTVKNAGTLSIDGKLSASSGGSLHLLASSLTTLSADSLLHDVNTINKTNFDGNIFFYSTDSSIMLTDWKSSVISQREYKQLLKTLESLTIDYVLSPTDVALWGVTVLQDNGTPLVTWGSGNEHVLAGDRITMTSASANHIFISGSYVAPQIVLDESSDTLTVGSSYGTGGTLTTIGLPNGTINLVQKADGSVGNLKIERSGTYTIGSGRQASGLLGTLEVEGTVKVNQGMQVFMEKLNLRDGLMSVIGANDLFTFLHTKEFNSQRGTLFIDSAMMSIDTMSNKTLSSKIILGKGALLNIGSMKGAAHAGLWTQQQQQFTQALTDISLDGALGINQVLTLKTGTAGGQIIVDKTANSAGAVSGQITGLRQALYFGDSSLLAIDASSADIQQAVDRGEALITLGGTEKSVYISDKSYLRLHEAKGNRDYIIISGAEDTLDAPAFSNSSNAAGNTPINGTIQGWTGTQVSTNTDMLNGNTQYTGNSIITRFHVNNASEIYKGLSGGMAQLVNGMYSFGANDLNSYHNGIKFLTRVTDNTNTYITRGAEARAMEGAARLPTVAGIHTSALAVADICTSTSLSRASSNMSSANQYMRSASQNTAGMWKALDGITFDEDASFMGKSLWITPLYNNTSTQAYAMGGFSSGSSSDLQGLAFGVDFITDDTEQWGISCNIGTGTSTSHGDFAKSTDTFKFFGMNAYQAYYFNNFNFIADLGISRSSHNLYQHLPVRMDVPGLRAKIHTNIASAGVRGEYTFRNNMLDISPYFGLRYSLLLTSPFNTTNESTLFSTSSSLQSLWAFPLGISVDKVWETDSPWRIKTFANVGLILNKGDRSYDAQVSMPDIGTMGSLKTPVIDPVSSTAELGLQVKSNNLDFGFQYSLARSKHSKSHGIFGTLSYTF